MSSNGEAGPRLGTPDVRSDWHEADSPVVAIIEAAAAATNREPTELPPLQEHVDADALDALLDGAASPSVGSVRMSFSYAGVDIVVDSGGDVEVWVPDI